MPCACNALETMAYHEEDVEFIIGCLPQAQGENQTMSGCLLILSQYFIHGSLVSIVSQLSRKHFVQIQPRDR